MHIDGDLLIIGVTLVTMVGMVALGPIGRAVADRLRGRGAAGAIGGVQDQLDDVIARLDDLQRQVGEIGERQDFAERLLAQARERGLLEAPK